jgi:hypothetical protein
MTGIIGPVNLPNPSMLEAHSTGIGPMPPRITTARHMASMSGYVANVIFITRFRHVQQLAIVVPQVEKLVCE